MAKKSIAASAEKQGAGDKETNTGCVKFISKFKEFHFTMPVLGADGKQETHTDADGNGKLKTWQQYDFTKVSAHKGKNGKIDPDTAFSFFMCDPAIHGDMFQKLVDYLTILRSNPKNQIFSEDEYFQNRNPEAYKIAKELSDKDTLIDTQAQKIKELEQRLGFKKG
jgi:hypothetical protein